MEETVKEYIDLIIIFLSSTQGITLITMIVSFVKMFSNMKKNRGETDNIINDILKQLKEEKRINADLKREQRELLTKLDHVRRIDDEQDNKKI